MYRIVAMVVLLLSPCLSVLAQTAAQRALDNEPEAQKIQAISQALQTPQRDPLNPNQGPSLGQTAINATVDKGKRPSRTRKQVRRRSVLPSLPTAPMIRTERSATPMTCRPARTHRPPSP